jgi:hypothetical protein
MRGLLLLIFLSWSLPADDGHRRLQRIGRETAKVTLAEGDLPRIPGWSRRRSWPWTSIHYSATALVSLHVRSAGQCGFVNKQRLEMMKPGVSHQHQPRTLVGEPAIQTAPRTYCRAGLDVAAKVASGRQPLLSAELLTAAYRWAARCQQRLMKRDLNVELSQRDQNVVRMKRL